MVDRREEEKDTAAAGAPPSKCPNDDGDAPYTVHRTEPYLLRLVTAPTLSSSGRR